MTHSTSAQGHPEHSRGVKNPALERVCVLVKPDGVMRGLTGTIIQRFEQRGLKLIALKMVQPGKEHIDEHYPKDPAWIKRLGEKTLKTYVEYGIDAKELLGSEKAEEIGPQVRNWILDYMTKAPLVAMIFEGNHAVTVTRKIAGQTMPYAAEVGTIRGDFGHDSPAAANSRQEPVNNIVHVSETAEEARHEIEHWFAPEEIQSYKRVEEHT